MKQEKVEKTQKSVNLPVPMWEFLKEESKRTYVPVSALILIALQEKYGKKAE